MSLMMSLMFLKTTEGALCYGDETIVLFWGFEWILSRYQGTSGPLSPHEVKFRRIRWGWSKDPLQGVQLGKPGQQG
jgi:hypothetical protein